MHPVIAKTLGGLTRAYYLRQLFFGLLFFAAFAALTMKSIHTTPVGTWVFMGINVLLYPYSRFVYESVVDFFTGNNLFVFNAVLLLTVKLITMLMCFLFAIFIAPLGLAYLYYHHSKNTA